MCETGRIQDDGREQIALPLALDTLLGRVVVLTVRSEAQDAILEGTVKS